MRIHIAFSYSLCEDVTSTLHHANSLLTLRNYEIPYPKGAMDAWKPFVTTSHMQRYLLVISVTTIGLLFAILAAVFSIKEWPVKETI
jgi:hypothetical protein